MEDNLDVDYTTGTKVRPTFISVLCILSWIYVGFTVLTSLNSAFTSQEELQEQLEISRAQIEESPMASNDFMVDILNFSDATMENTKFMNLLSLVLMLIQGVAVFMMFKLKKLGFYLYFLVNILLISETAYFIPWPNIMSTMILGFSILITVVFVILYAVNLKHMN